MIIPIEKDLIPYKFDIDLGGILFGFEVHYNPEGAFFTVDLSVGDEVLVYGEKLSYGQVMFETLTDERVPKIIPTDPSGKENEVTFDNLSETVFLKVINDETIQ